MKTEIKIITPEIAAQLLRGNPGNRDLRPTRVLHYTNQMLLGHWKIGTGEAIQISKSRKILNGQHRLLAIIKSGVSLEFLIVSELEDGVFDVLDRGAVRTNSDIFKIAGTKYCTAMPQTILSYILLKKGLSIKGSQIHKKLTSSELLAMYYERPEYWIEILRNGNNFSLNFKGIITRAFAGSFYAFIADVDKLKAIDFMTQLSTGKDVTNGTIYLLRDRLIADRVAITKLPLRYKVALMILAWNAFAMQIEKRQLRWNESMEFYPTLLNYSTL